MRNAPISQTRRESVRLTLLLTATVTLCLACGTLGAERPASPAPPWENASHPQPLPVAAATRSEATPSAPEAPSFEETLEQADRLKEAGRFGDAIATYVEALQLEPENPLPKERIAFVHLRKDPARAERIFREVLDGHSERIACHLGLGLALLAQGDAAGAARTLEEGRRIDANAASVRATLGVAYDRLRRHQEAQREYQAALQQRPDDFETLNNLGVSYLATESHEQAVQAFEKAVALRPDDAAVRNNRGFALARLRRYDEALREFRSAGSEADAQNNLGYVCSLNGDFDRAIYHFESALAGHPADELTVVRNLRATQAALRRQEDFR